MEGPALRTRPPTRRYPLGPLLERTGSSMVALTLIAPCNGTERRTRCEEGVTEPIADRLAVAFGYHPHSIWPEMLDHAIADAGHPDAELWAQGSSERRRFQLYERDQRRVDHHRRWRTRHAPELVDSHLT